MAKKRTRPVTPPMRDNPLDMGLVSSIGAEPKLRITEQEQEPPPRDRLPEPAPPQERPEPRPVQARPATAPDRPKPQQRVRPERPRRAQDFEKDSYQLKTRFTTLEGEQIDLFRRSMEDRLGVKLKATQISRALWTLALRAEEELDSLPTPELRRPSYGDTLGMAAFEDEIADYLLLALKRTKRQS